MSRATGHPGGDDALWLIWSNEHGAWWAPNRLGYWSDVAAAGRYSLAEALEICKVRNPTANKHGHKLPAELVVPSPELCEQWQTASAAASPATATAPDDDLLIEAVEEGEEMRRMLEQAARDLNAAHDEIVKGQGGDPAAFDWPEWSSPANTIRWIERHLGIRLAKTTQWTTYPDAQYGEEPPDSPERIAAQDRLAEKLPELMDKALAQATIENEQRQSVEPPAAPSAPALRYSRAEFEADRFGEGGYKEPYKSAPAPAGDEVEGLRQAAGRLRRALCRLSGIAEGDDTPELLAAMEATIRQLPVPEEDRAATIDAIHAIDGTRALLGEVVR